MALDAAWYEARIVATKALILKYEAAIDALATGAQMYQLDTGQTRQLVTKAQLPQLRDMLAALEARLDRLIARQGGGVVYVKPGW
jgi:hypothetical protein